MGFRVIRWDFIKNVLNEEIKAAEYRENNSADVVQIVAAGAQKAALQRVYGKFKEAAGEEGSE